MRLNVLTCCAVIAGFAMAAPEWEDETVFQVGREPARASLMPTADGTTMSLNGSWKFNFVMRPEERPVDFWQPTFDVSAWKTIEVPLSWQMAGYGTPIYSNELYPFRYDAPRVMAEPPQSWTAYKERNSVGSYRRTFTLPENFSKGRVYLRFDGVESAYYVWLNGQKIGYSEDTFTAGEFDITDALKEGDNILAVEVYRWCDGSYLEDQDFWRLAGIFRDVTLFTTPDVQVRDVWVRSGLEEDYTTGVIEGDVWVRNTGKTPSAETTVQVSIGNIYHQTLTVPTMAPGAETKITLPKGSVKEVLRWTAETPNLYDVAVTLANGDERRFETGFRTVEVSKQGELLINGVSVILKGVNRHEMDPDRGRSVTREKMELDMKMLKAGNFNAVRTSHYPNHPYWYELCDKYGVYVMDEANIEAHEVRWTPRCLNDRPSWHAAYAFRVQNAFQRAKNHPSIIMWSLGNETGPGKNLEDQGDWLQENDPTRLVHYCDFPENSPHNDMDSAMYRPHGTLEDTAKRHTHRPFVHVEYAHSMGNACGAFDEYIKIYEKYPRMIGGFIWDFVDQGLRGDKDEATGLFKVNPYRGKSLVYGGLFGDNPNFGNFCDNGVITAEREPKGQFWEIKHAQQYFGFAWNAETNELTVTNKYFHQAAENYAVYDIAGKVIAKLPTLAPGESTVVRLVVETEPQGLDYPVFVSNRAVTAQDILTEAEAWFAVPGTRQTPDLKRKLRAPKCAMEVEEADDGSLVITSNRARCPLLTFRDGVIAGICHEGKELIAAAPQFTLYRAPINNDRWILGSATWRSLMDQENECVKMTWRKVGESDDAIQIISQMRTKGGNVPYEYTLVWTVYMNTVICEGVFYPQTNEEVIPRLGFELAINKDLSAITYEGLGPWENYVDRKSSVWFNRFKSTVKDFFVPYPETQEQANREGVRWMLFDDNDVSICFFPADLNKTFSMSVNQWDAKTFHKAKLPSLLPTPEKTWLHIDYAQTGLGNGSCGPRPWAEHQVYNKPFTFGFSMRFGSRPFKARPLRETAGLAVITRDSRNQVTVTPYREGAKMMVAINDGEAKPYTGPFTLESGKISVTVLPEGDQLATPAVERVFRKEVKRTAWKVLSLTSEEPGEGDAAHVFDGKPNTYWHTAWRNINVGYPHTLVLDLGEEQSVGGIKMLPRQDEINGLIGACTIEFSTDNKTWTTVFDGATGWNGNNRAQKTIEITPIKGRYLRFTATKPAIDGHVWATLSELSLIHHD